MTKKRKRAQKKRKKVQVKQIRNTIIIAAVFVSIVGYWAIVQFSGSGGNNYPSYIEGVGYSTPVVSADSSKVTIPKKFVENNKLVYVDLKLEEPIGELVYQSRRIPLSMYGDGKYLPLVIMSTPKGKTLAGIRVCEPCRSFDFHIVEKKYLQCDACGTRWNIETLQGKSGGCQEYPPPGLAVTTTNRIEISLVSTGLKVLA